MRDQGEVMQETEIQVLEQSLEEMETALEEHYRDIGKQILEMAEKESKGINQEVDEIIETQLQLASLQKKTRCPECFTFNDHDSRYCKHCGKKLEIVRESK